MIKIGNLKVDTKVFTAPMAGVTDYPYRQILRQQGAELVFTEMVSSMGLLQGNSNTHKLIEFERQGGLIGVQIFGDDPAVVAEAAAMVEEKYQPDLIDLNFGCPAPKIVKNGAGSALMRQPDKVYEMVAEAVGSCNLPVTVKIRKGWDDEYLTGLEVAKAAEEAGAALLTVHGRTREEFYSGKADWSIISDIVNQLEIPVIGNGDVFAAEDAMAMIKKTGVNGVMVARGIQGYPWLVKEIDSFLNKGTRIENPSYEERIEMAIKHLKMAVSYYGEVSAVPLMRKHLAWYIKGMPFSARQREKINSISDKKLLIDSLYEYLKAIQSN
ncbi:MAG: tRNA dihydrouridine synthase DusB [Bacillota bacterium]